jgi:hypothetical protein
VSWIISWKRLALVLAAVGLILFSLLVVAYALKSLHDQAERNKTALVALCAQRHDLDQRIIQTRALLRRTHARVIFAIPRSVIVTGFRRDRRTRRNLNILDCQEQR